MKLSYTQTSTTIIFRKILGGLIFVSLIISDVGLARADVLFDSSSDPVFDLDPVTDEVTLNASFSTNEHPIALKGVKLLWRRGQNENGLIRLNLLRDNNATPGPKLEMLAEIDSGALPTGDQWLTVPVKIEKTLDAKTRYWIQIKATAASGAMAYSRKHEGYGVQSEYYLNMYGLHRNSETGPYIFKIEGDPQKN
jgi:hypothetical protein